MASFDKLQKLISLCKNSVTINVNDHRDVHQSVQEYVDQLKRMTLVDDNDIDDEKLAKMIALDTIINIQCYPHNAIGSYVLYHYDLLSAIDEALRLSSSSN